LGVNTAGVNTAGVNTEVVITEYFRCKTTDDKLHSSNAFNGKEVIDAHKKSPIFMGQNLSDIIIVIVFCLWWPSLAITSFLEPCLAYIYINAHSVPVR